MSYNSRAINTLCNKKNLNQVISDVLYNLVVDDDACFSDVMEQIMSDFENLASEMVASKVIGIDLAHYYLRSHNVMSATDVENMLDNMVFKTFDKCVNKLLKQIEQGDYRAAWKTYRHTLENRRRDESDLSEAVFNDYLQQVNIAMGIVAPAVMTQFFADNQ